MTDTAGREKAAREAVRRALQKLPSAFSREGNRKIFRRQLETQPTEFLVLAAREGDKDAIGILRDRARAARQAGTEVPGELHEFVWELFIDGKPKAPAGESRKDRYIRDVTIALMVKIVSQEFRFPEYRNTEHRGDATGPMSACLLVAQEMGLSERTVERIWADRKDAALRPPSFH